MKRYRTLLFFVEEQGLENRKLRKLFGKGRRIGKVSRFLKRCSRSYSKVISST